MIVLVAISGWLRTTFGTGIEGMFGIWTTPLQIVGTALATFLATAVFATLVQRIPRLGKWIVG